MTFFYAWHHKVDEGKFIIIFNTNPVAHAYVKKILKLWKCIQYCENKTAELSGPANNCQTIKQTVKSTKVIQ